MVSKYHGVEEYKEPSTMLRSSGRVSDWDQFLCNAMNLQCVAPVPLFPHVRSIYQRKWNCIPCKLI